MAQVLMTCILLAALTTVALFVFSRSAPAYIPHVDVQQRVDGASDILYLKHSGGEAVDTRNMLLIVSVDGQKKVLSDTEISGYLGKSYWEAGDVLSIDMYDKWGLRLDSDDCVEVFLVDVGSKKLIQRGSMPMEGLCKPLLELNRWYFFTTVEGDDRDEVNLGHLQDCGIAIDFYPSVPGDSSEDILLGKDNTDYFAKNAFSHDMQYDSLDLTFGFDDEALKGFRSLPHNATILMIYGLQSEPADATLTIAGESIPVFNGGNSGSKNWFIYNKTVSVNISSVSELEFSIHLIQENKDIDIDYLAVYLS